MYSGISPWESLYMLLKAFNKGGQAEQAMPVDCGRIKSNHRCFIIRINTLGTITHFMEIKYIQAAPLIHPHTKYTRI